jgi:hypothetical protein
MPTAAACVSVSAFRSDAACVSVGQAGGCWFNCALCISWAPEVPHLGNMMVQEGDTPLHVAASHKMLEVVDLLLAAGASIDATNKVSVPSTLLESIIGCSVLDARSLQLHAAQLRNQCCLHHLYEWTQACAELPSVTTHHDASLLNPGARGIRAAVLCVHLPEWSK